ncbi:hypothetical protein CHRYSEO8AT_550120 [Chryseobacterium sp. 8AT]|nr:hypothetical protein CHRYSEO8AT_550120 [Chryseobacterium sp. 8AT]
MIVLFKYSLFKTFISLKKRNQNYEKLFHLNKILAFKNK